jgi:hypothetical protein
MSESIVNTEPSMIGRSRILFLDCDGVLANFEKRVFQIFKQRPENIPPNVMWPKLQQFRKSMLIENVMHTCGFFDSLELMPDAMELFEFSKRYEPKVLTGVPRGNWAQPQKRKWVQAKFGPKVEVICCLAREKNLYCTPGAVLVDDTLKYRDYWIRAGGIFVHHVSAKSSIEQLIALGFQ